MRYSDVIARISPFLFFLSIISCLAEATAEKIIIKSCINLGNWIPASPIFVIKGDALQLRVDSIANADIIWYQIIPDCADYYKNANFPDENDPYTWVGYAKIKYGKVELPGSQGRWTITPKFNRVSSTFYHDSVGSFWVQAVVKANGKEFSSPGIECNDEQGLSPKIFRVSVLTSNSFVGYITSFFNVPGLFGSTPYQARNYIGADCADVLTAAYARYRGKMLNKDYNVSMLANSLKRVASFTLTYGNPDSTIIWGKSIQPGDAIAVQYDSSKRFQHIGVLYRDANESGTLDSCDLVLHAGPFPLQVDSLASGAFDGRIRILRFGDFQIQ